MKKNIILLLALVLGFSVLGNDLPKRPEPPTLVTDFANVFNRNEKAALERKLVDYFAATSTQIAVVTVATLGDYDIAEYAIRLGEEWGVGSSKFDNGIIMVIKPKTSTSKGEAFIAVGYGLEGAVPDATAKQVVENELLPRFRENDMYGGVDKATTVLIQLTKGEYNHQQYAQRTNAEGGFSPFLFFLLIFIVFPILFGRKRRGIYSTGGRNSSLPFWIAMGMMSGAGRKHPGSFGDFSRGSGSFGGGSSFGSFGGFGGGKFGGGGAGGSW